MTGIYKIHVCDLKIDVKTRKLSATYDTKSGAKLDRAFLG